jgi:integrase
MSLRQKTVRDYLVFLMLSGLRRNEAATLRWSDMDFEGKALTVRAEGSKN